MEKHVRVAATVGICCLLLLADAPSVAAQGRNRPPPCVVYPFVDNDGNDIAVFHNVVNVYQCAAYCYANPGIVCVAIQWNFEGTCWLKRRIAPPTFKLDGFSVVTNGSDCTLIFDPNS